MALDKSSIGMKAGIEAFVKAGQAKSAPGMDAGSQFFQALKSEFTQAKSELKGAEFKAGQEVIGKATKEDVVHAVHMADLQLQAMNAIKNKLLETLDKIYSTGV